MHLARTSISTLPRPQLNALVLTAPDPSHFVLATDAGFELWQLYPLRFVLRRELPGSLSHASCYLHSSLFFLVGGGSSPVYAPNKVVLWDESCGAVVLELEFRERVLGLASRRGLLAVVFLRRVVLFEIDEDAVAGTSAGQRSRPGSSGGAVKGKAREVHVDTGSARILRRSGEWPTFENPQGLIAMSTTPGSSFLAIPGRQAGHVHLLHVHPVPVSANDGRSPPVAPSPSPARSQILIAHTTPLSTLACTPSGSLLSTTSNRGTLVRVFDGRSSALVRELRRGADRAIMRQGGVAFSARGEWVGGWSDKGTIHAFSLDEGIAAASSRLSSGGAADDGDEKSRNRPSTLSKLMPYLPAPLSLPKYFLSEWSHATYALPSVAKHSQTLASLGTTLARGAAGGSVPGAGGSGERERLKESDEDEDERCVLVWIEVDVSTERERERLRLQRGRLPPAALTSASKDPHSKHKHKHGQHRQQRQGAQSDEDEDDANERPLHPSSLPTPSSAAAATAARARPFGTIHAAHRRDTDGRPPGPPRPSHSIGGTPSSSKHHHHRRSDVGTSARVCGATEHQLVALTFSGGFYRLTLPSSTLGPGASPNSSRKASNGGRPFNASDAGGPNDLDDRASGDDDGSDGGSGSHARRTGQPRATREMALAEYRRFGAGGWGFVFGSREDGREWNEGEW